jgi:hypothetical protein
MGQSRSLEPERFSMSSPEKIKSKKKETRQ